MAKTKVSIFLIKQGISIDNIVKLGVEEMQINGNKLYFKESSLKAPKWVKSFFQGANIDEERLKCKSTSAVILYHVRIPNEGERVFALCFGYGRTLLNEDAIEHMFGLLVVLNSINEKSFKSIDTTTLDAIPHNSRIQSSSLVNIENFNIDIQKDLLKAITGKSTDGFLVGTLTGTSSLSATIDKKYDNIDGFLKGCYALYKSEDYKRNFEWIDWIQPIKDVSLQDVLNAKMLEQLNENEPINVWISIPEIIDYNTIDSFKLSSDNTYCDIDVMLVKSDFDVVFNQQNINQLKITCLSADGTPIRKWPIRKCLYSEVIYEEKQYILNEGRWYKINSEYAEKVNIFYSEANLSNITLPDFTCKDEKDYNISVVNSNNERYCLMDRNLIPMDGSTIEFCDIYTIDKQLIHVKKYHGSSVLSHLFSQGEVSAEIFLGDRNFRMKLNEKLSPNFRISENQINPSDYEIIYAIAKRDTITGTRPELPFFSKVSFMNAAKHLNRYGYRVSLLGINYTFIA